MDSAGIAAMLFAATRLVLLANLEPNLLVAACFFRGMDLESICFCILLVTVLMPRRLAIRPDRAALKAILVKVSMLVRIKDRKVVISMTRFIVVSIFVCVSCSEII